MGSRIVASPTSLPLRKLPTWAGLKPRPGLQVRRASRERKKDPPPPKKVQVNASARLEATV